MDMNRKEKIESYLEIQAKIAKFGGFLTCSIFY